MRNDFAIEIPYLGGLIATRSLDKEITGLKELQAKNETRVRNGIMAYDLFTQLKAQKKATGQVNPETKAQFNEVKGDTEENRKIAAEEVQRCEALGVKVNEILKLEDLVRDDNLVFAATGITHGELLKGISRRGNLATTETLLIRGKSRTIRKIQSIHYLDRKDSEIYEILRN